MNVKLENKENNIVELEIEVEVEEFDKAIQKAYLKNAKDFKIAGFRKGKVPRKVIEQYYGEGVFYEDAINILFPETYDKAIEETNIEPVDSPELDVKQIGKDKNLILVVKTTVKPKFELKIYKGIEVNKAEYNVTDDDVDNELKQMQEKNARLITVEDRTAQQSDTVNIDFEGFVGDEPFEGGKAEGHNLEIGSGQFIDNFEEQIIGKNIGEEFDVNVNFPEEYQVDELAGKPALFKVKLNQIKFKELPEIDDEFVKDISEFDTLDELKKYIEDKLIKEAEHKAKHELEDAIINKIVENVEIDIPEVMIENQIESMVKEFEYNLTRQGYNIEQYLELTNMKSSDFKNQFKGDAEKRVKTSLILEAIKETEEIEVSEQEIDDEINKFSETYKMDVEKFKETLKPEMLSNITNELAMRKTVELLVESAKIV